MTSKTTGQTSRAAPGCIGAVAAVWLVGAGFFNFQNETVRDADRLIRCRWGEASQLV